MSRFFVPQELKTIEVDAEKKIFRINGEDFGKNCTGFSIRCNRYDDFEVRVEIDTTVVFATYKENQQKDSEVTFQTNDTDFT